MGKYLSALVADLLQAYPDGEALREFVARHVAHIKAHHSGASSSPYILYWRLITASLALARATVDNTFAQENCPTRQFVATALAKIAQNNRGDSVAYMKRLVESGSADLQAAVGTAFGLFGPDELPLTTEEMTLLRNLLGATDAWIADCAVLAVRSVLRATTSLQSTSSRPSILEFPIGSRTMCLWISPQKATVFWAR